MTEAAIHTPRSAAGDAFARRVHETFAGLKAEPFGTPAARRADTLLLPFTADCAGDARMIALLTRWRRENQHGFTKVFAVTEAGTAEWCRSQLVERPDRLLLFVADGAGRLVGHVGLSSFDFAAGTCEIDNIVRGEADAPRGVMAQAVRALLAWTARTLRPARIGLRTLADNTRALALYHRLGFVPRALHPLTWTLGPDFEEWVPAGPGDPTDRFFLEMTYVTPQEH